jgi:hypothetical protein
LRKHVAVGALHNSAERFDPPKCYPRTREAILAKIEAWVKERPQNGNRLVLWMYGPAGAGKSAIAQSIAELCKALLAAAFFFSRTAPDRSDNSRLVATLVWQLIKVIPEMRESVLATLEHDPTLLSQTPATQMKALIVNPMNQVPGNLLEKHPRLVIIDGLDECFSPESQDDILNILSTSLQDLITPFYFLIASRPHINIREAFTSNPLRSMTHTLPLEYDYQSTQDIHHFLTSSFGKIRAKNVYLPSHWPKKGDIEVLTGKSSGQFIYAATVMRYIARGHHGHEKRLTSVLESQLLNNSASPFAALDALYLQIFQSVAQDEIGKVMEVLGALIFLNQNNMNQLWVLEGFFGYREGELASVMGDMLSLVHVPNSPHEIVKIHHASLPDFLLDHTRSLPFHLDRATICLNLAQRCIKGRGFRREITQYRGLYLRYMYEKIFTECIMTSPFTENLSDFLLGFSLWDSLPARFPLFADQEIGQMSLSLLEKFHRPVCACFPHFLSPQLTFFLCRVTIPTQDGQKFWKLSWASSIGGYTKSSHQLRITFFR